MSKMLKVTDQVGKDLENLKVGHQTFSDVIGELLGTRLKVLEMFNVLEGQLKFREWQRDQADLMRTARLERADLDARTLKQ